MSQTSEIADAYHAATINGAWYGPSLTEMLSQVTPALATKSPAPGANTISALLQHMLLWNERARLASDAHPMPKWEAEKEWAEPPVPWPNLVARWNESRDLLEAHIRNFPVADLSKQVPGRTYPYSTLFPGILQHTIYHAGQIAMTLGILRRQSR